MLKFCFCLETNQLEEKFWFKPWLEQRCSPTQHSGQIISKCNTCKVYHSIILITFCILAITVKSIILHYLTYTTPTTHTVAPILACFFSPCHFDQEQTTATLTNCERINNPCFVKHGVRAYRESVISIGILWMMQCLQSSQFTWRLCLHC